VDLPVGQSVGKAGSNVAISVRVAAVEDPRSDWLLSYN